MRRDKSSFWKLFLKFPEKELSSFSKLKANLVFTITCSDLLLFRRYFLRLVSAFYCVKFSLKYIYYRLTLLLIHPFTITNLHWKSATVTLHHTVENQVLLIVCTDLLLLWLIPLGKVFFAVYSIAESWTATNLLLSLLGKESRYFFK